MVSKAFESSKELEQVEEASPIARSQWSTRLQTALLDQFYAVIYVCLNQHGGNGAHTVSGPRCQPRCLLK